MPEIAPDRLSERLATDGDDLCVLDVRDAEDYDAWHIPESTNIELHDRLIDDPRSAEDALNSLPEDKEIVTVCAKGVVSQTATEVLQQLGYEAATLTDGMAGWSRVHRQAALSVDIDGRLIQVSRPGKGCLSYVVVSDGAAAVFDASHYLEEYEEILDGQDAELVAVFDTHAHADHVSGGAELADCFDVPYYLHPADAIERSAAELCDGQTLPVGDVEIEVIHTPGHSPGSVCFDLGDAALLTGDTLFHDSVGRVELGVEAGLEESDVEQNAARLYESLQRLLDRPNDEVVLPAHDPGSPSPPVSATLGSVKTRNADLNYDRDAFIEMLASDISEQPPNFERVKQVNIGLESRPRDELTELELGPNNCAVE